MILTALAAAALCSSQSVQLRMEFVPVEGANGTHIEILDARQDLSAVGFSWSNWMDTIPSSPVFVVKGRTIEGQGIWPSVLVGKDEVQGLLSQYNPFLFRIKPKPQLVEAKLKGTGATHQRFVWKARMPRPSAAFCESSEFKVFDDSWWSGDWSAKQRAKGTTVSSARTAKVQSLQVANLCHQPNAGSGFYDDNEKVCLIKQGKKFVKLEEAVLNPTGVHLIEVAWLDKSGWMIASATKGATSGLAWLYPVRSAQKGQSSSSSSSSP